MTTASSRAALPELRLQFWKPGRGFLHIGREVTELLHLAHFDDQSSLPGQRLAHSMASSLDFTWIIQ